MTIDEAIKFCDEKAKNIKLKAEPQTFIDIALLLEELKELRKGKREIPIATIKFSKEDMQELVDEKVKEIELDIQAIRNKAINDFLNQMEAEIESSSKFIREYDDSIAQKAYYSGLCQAKRIAEQLKEGGDKGE